MSSLVPRTRRTGRVKFFNSIKGYGFIIPHHQEPGENVEIFVHHTAIQNDGGFKSLAEGEEVEYDLMQGPKGMQASHVTGPDGVSVKGDPNAGKQHSFGQFAGFSGGGGHGGYMQMYSQPYSGGQQIRQPQYGMGGGQFQPGGPSGGPMYATSPYAMYSQLPAFGGLYGGTAPGLFGNATGGAPSNQSSPVSAGFAAAQAYNGGPPQPGGGAFSGQPVSTQGTGSAAAGILGAGTYHNFYGLHSNPGVGGGAAGFFYTGPGSSGGGGGGPGGGSQQQQ